MSFFSSKKAPIQYRLILDVEPNSIGYGLTIIGSTKLEYINRQYISYDKKPTLEQIQSKLSILLKSIVSDVIIRYTNNGKIHSVLCIHSSAWSIVETHVIDLKFPKPVQVQEKLIIDSFRKHKNETANENKQDKLELVYQHVQKIRLNGYFSKNPWGKTAQNISCDFIESYIENSIRKICDDNLLQFSSSVTHIPEAFIIANNINLVFKDIGDFLLIHIGGETTEIIYSINKNIQKTVSTPSGVSNIIRSLAKLLDCSNSLAFSHVSMAAKSYRTLTKKEQPVVNKSIEIWRDDLIKGIDVICGKNIPENILFFSSQHESSITDLMLDKKKLSNWSGKEHSVTRICNKKSFEQDIMIVAGAQYVVEY